PTGTKTGKIYCMSLPCATFSFSCSTQRERDAGSRCVVSMVSSSITIQDPRDSQNRRSFCFDYAYWSHSGFTRDNSGLWVPEEPGGRYADQDSVFQDLGEGILENALQGYNATLLAYGQTGSGKSYSMVGYGPNKGLVPKLCDRLFQAIRENQENRQCQVFFSMLEIYNEQVVDLLSRGSRTPGGLRVREEQQRGFYVEGLRTVPCESAPQVEQLMEQGTRTRTTAATHMNANSSRSHMLIILQLKQIFSKESITKQSNINLVDLAGSERQRSSGSEADRLKEGTAINLSLTTLGNVIRLACWVLQFSFSSKYLNIRYRHRNISWLLFIIFDIIFKIATLSPADICYEESLSTLRYAERAKRIQNRAVVNESPTERLVKELKAENARLLQRLSRLGQEGRRANDETSKNPCLNGAEIQERHAVFRNEQRRVTLNPLTGSNVIVNGNTVSQTTELQHLDRLILGSNCTYLFIGYPSERGADDWSRYDYDYFQSELAAAEGIHLGESSAGSSQTDPSLLAVFYDYIKLMPMVAEVNQMSQELNKGVDFKLEIKNLALSDPKGHDLEKDIVVRVTSKGSKQVWVWSKTKFVNRKFLMEEVYQHHQAEDKDPFWDPVEPLLLGTAHFWLQSLAFRIPLEEQLEVLGSEGTEEAILQRSISTSTLLLPSSPLGEDDILIDPSEILGRRLDFQLVLDQCCGLRWIREARNRGVQIGFRLFDCSQPLYTPAVWHNVNPLLDHRVHFASLHTSQRLLDYLQSSAVVLELWGLQGTNENMVFARALKVFYHSMTSVRGQLQRLRRHRPSESDLLGFRLFVDEQSRLLRDFSEQLEQSVSTLKQDVAAIVRRKRERSGVWS
uniref:Kinesin motor domain-containing protein n=1 Tax=Amphiprion ocellaris TaxID=80972 RepID=A0A3Q1BJX4_AMPOC